MTTHFARHFSLISSSLELRVSVPFRPKTMDGSTGSVILSIRLHVYNLGHSIPFVKFEGVSL